MTSPHFVQRSANQEALLKRSIFERQPGEGEIVEIRASARSFLHNQIRSFAGTLQEVGCGRWDADDVSAALEARDRQACGPVAPTVYT